MAVRDLGRVDAPGHGKDCRVADDGRPRARIAGRRIDGYIVRRDGQVDVVQLTDQEVFRHIDWLLGRVLDDREPYGGIEFVRKEVDARVNETDDSA